MKKLMISIFIFLLALPLGIVSATVIQPDANVKVFIHGEQVEFDVDPLVVNGTTLVQFTPIFERLGINYKWIDYSKVILGSKDKRTIRLQIDNPVVSVNDNNIKLSATPLLFANLTFVPLRFIGEATGLTVDWNKETKEVHILKGNQSEKYEQPNNFEHTFGLNFEASDIDFLRAVKVEPDQYALDTYSFFNYEMFGYMGALYATMNESDKLSSLSYEYTTKQANASLITVYRDIEKQVEQLYGVANESKIKQNTTSGSIELEDITDQELLRGVRNDTYYAYSNWNLSKINLSVILIHDAGEVKVIVYINEAH